MCRTGQAIGQATGQAVNGFAVDGLGSQRLAGNGLGSRLQAVYMCAAWSSCRFAYSRGSCTCELRYYVGENPDNNVNNARRGIREAIGCVSL